MMGVVSTSAQDLQSTRVVIVGGGPWGYEAALIARRRGAEVTLVERDGLGGSAVLTDVVPSKTLIATAESMTVIARASELGIRPAGAAAGVADAAAAVAVDLGVVNNRVLGLAAAQSADITARLEREGVRIVRGSGWIVPANLHAPIRQDAILLNPGAANPAAAAFLAYLRSDAARALLRASGYTF